MCLVEGGEGGGGWEKLINVWDLLMSVDRSLVMVVVVRNVWSLVNGGYRIFFYI